MLLKRGRNDFELKSRLFKFYDTLVVFNCIQIEQWVITLVPQCMVKTSLIDFKTQGLAILI